MIETLRRNWWLFALGGVLDATCAAIYLSLEAPAQRTVILIGGLTISAGFWRIAGALRRSSQGICWPLAANGIALAALGLLLAGAFGHRIQFRTIANLLAIIAASMAIFEWIVARALHPADRRLLTLAAAVSTFYAAAFALLKPVPHNPRADFFWFGSYFAFSAAAMLWLALRLKRIDHAPSVFSEPRRPAS